MVDSEVAIERWSSVDISGWIAQFLPHIHQREPKQILTAPLLRVQCPRIVLAQTDAPDLVAWSCFDKDSVASGQQEGFQVHVLAKLVHVALRHQPPCVCLPHFTIERNGMAVEAEEVELLAGFDAFDEGGAVEHGLLLHYMPTDTGGIDDIHFPPPRKLCWRLKAGTWK